MVKVSQESTSSKRSDSYNKLKCESESLDRRADQVRLKRQWKEEVSDNTPTPIEDGMRRKSIID